MIKMYSLLAAFFNGCLFLACWMRIYYIQQGAETWKQSLERLTSDSLLLFNSFELMFFVVFVLFLTKKATGPSFYSLSFEALYQNLLVLDAISLDLKQSLANFRVADGGFKVDADTVSGDNESENEGHYMERKPAD